jgi:hypothetical protein
MSPRIGDRELPPDQFAKALDAIIEEAFPSNEWKLVAHALQVGMADEATRIATCCRVGELIMRRLFVLRESDTKVTQFLVEKLFFDPEKGGVFALMAIESARRAVGVVKEGRSLDDVVEELVKEHGAEPEIARPMVETGIRFLERWTPERGFVFLAIVSLLCNWVVAGPLALTVWLVLFFGYELHWFETTAAAVAVVSALRCVGLVVEPRIAAGLGKRPTTPAPREAE